MTEEELICLKTKKAYLKETISFANELLLKYKNMNASNEEEYKERCIICNALEYYVDKTKQEVSGLDITIKKFEKLYNKIPKRLKELVGKKIKVTSVYDDYFKDVVGKIGTVLDVKRDELDEQWVLEVDIRVVEMWDKNGNSYYPNYRLFIGSDRYRTIKE